MRWGRTIGAVTMAGLLGAGCGAAKEAKEELRELREARLPPAETFFHYLPENAQEALDQGLTGEAEQALCASDSAAYAALRARIELYNEELADRLAVMKLAMRAAKRQLQREGEWEYTASGEERSVTIRAVVAEDDSIAYEATFEGPNVAAYTFLVGTLEPEGEAGSWSILRPDGAHRVEVVWSKTGDELHVERSVVGTDRGSVYHRAGTTVTVTFAGADHAGVATWDTETKDGSLTSSEGGQLCWDHAEPDDYCAVDCT